MVVIRPVRLDDLDDLVALTEQTGHGLTTLPRDRDLLRRRVVESLRAFEVITDPAPRGQSYLLVLEDLKTGRVCGTSGIVSKVGGFEPFYAYRIETTIHESQMLKVHQEIKTLHLVFEHNGPCEIGTLFLGPESRRDGNGRLLSLSRFLFMAEHPDLFDPIVIAEMRGVIDEHGHSPFWDAVGRHFFNIDFLTADYLSIINKRFIADLMPRHPIYIPMLPKPAQEVIAQVHPQTAPALKILEDEGMRFSGMVDIFEAGPIVSCPRDQIRTVRESQVAAVSEISDGPIDHPVHLLCTSAPAEFRACKGPIRLQQDGSICLTESCAMALRVRIGQRVRYAPLRAAQQARADANPDAKARTQTQR